MKLLTRDEFFKAVMQRDRKTCVHCCEYAVDAHHLIDRKCFTDGGYYIDNGVSLCSQCHLLAEHGLLSPQQLRNWAGINCVVLPEGFDKDLQYDKWGIPMVEEETAIDQCFLPIQSLNISPDLFDEVLAQFIVDNGLLDTFEEYATEWAKNPSVNYDPEYGDDKECICGHVYSRHFDTYDNMFPIGCKYCRCQKFTPMSKLKMRT